jgi:hypothetical protein
VMRRAVSRILLFSLLTVFGANRLVGHNHLEVMTVFIGNEQVQLDCILVLFAVLAADEYEAGVILKKSVDRSILFA